MNRNLGLALIFSGSLILARAARASQVQSPAHDHFSQVVTQPVQMKPMLLQGVGEMINRAYDLIHLSAEPRTADLEAFALGKAENPREAARAEAARLVLSWIANPHEFDQRGESLKAELGPELFLQLKMASRSLPKNLSMETLQALQKRYSSPGKGLDETAAELAQDYDGWREGWSDVERDRLNFSFVRHYVLEKPGQARIAKKFTESSLSLKEPNVPDPVHWESSSLRREAGLSDDSGTDFIEMGIFALRVFNVPWELKAALWLNFTSSLFWVGSIMGVDNGYLPYWTGLGLYLAAPSIGLALAGLRSRRLNGLSQGHDGQTRLTALEAMGKLRDARHSIVRAKEVSFLVGLTAAALTPGLLLGQWLLKSGSLPLLLAPIQSHLEGLVSVASAAGTLLAAGLLGWAWGLRKTQRLAELKLDLLKLDGLQKPE